MEECIWERIEEMDTPGFFVTAEIGRRGGDFPDGIEAFIELKMNRIRAGLSARRFLYQEGGWQIYVTFFPTDRVVTERYALKNKVLARGYR